MPITVTPKVIPKVFGDDFGWFKSFNEKEFSATICHSATFVEDNHSSSKKGVLSGLHYQLVHIQVKLVRACHGVVIDVVDLRQSSSAFGPWVGIELSAENKKQLWVPLGFVYGFLVLSEAADFLYKTTDYWHAASEKCIIWNDPDFQIQLPDIGMGLILNPKDVAGVAFKEAQHF